MINQNFENITQSGTSQVIEASVTGTSLTAPQFYSCLFCLTIVIIVTIVMLSKLIQTIILRANYINPKIIEEIKKQIVAELK